MRWSAVRTRLGGPRPRSGGGRDERQVQIGHDDDLGCIRLVDLVLGGPRLDRVRHRQDHDRRGVAVVADRVVGACPGPTDATRVLVSELRGLASGEDLAERGRVLPGLGLGLPDAERPFVRRRARLTGEPFHRSAELPEHLGRLHPCVAADRHHGTRPHQDHAGCGVDLADQADGHRADPVVHHHDVRSVHRDRSRQLGRRGRVAHHRISLALEDEAQ